MRISTKKMSAVIGIAAGFACATSAFGQFGGGGAEWNTTGLNAQRTSWVKTDKYISEDAIKDGDFRFQWKLKADNPSGRANAIIGATSSGGGLSKPLNVILTSSNTLTTVDNDTGVPGWVKHFDVAAGKGTSACPAGMTANGSRPVPLIPRPPAGMRFMMRPATGYHSVLGEPGKGLPADITSRSFFRPPTPAPAAKPAAGAASGAAAARPAPVGDALFGGGDEHATYKSYFANGRFGSNSGFFILTSDGMLRTIADSNGVELKAPVQFVPANAHASDLTAIPENNSAWHAYVVYTSTSNDCGGVPNRVWAVDLADDAKPITHFDTGASPVGDLAFTEGGTVVVAVGKGKEGAAYSDAVIALEPKSLQPKAWFSDASADFASTPIVLKAGSKELIAEASKDGRIFLLDADAPGGSDHKTALFVSPAYSAGKTNSAELASWQDDSGATYIAEAFSGSAPSGVAGNGDVKHGGIVTLKLSDEGGKVSLSPVWVSNDMTSPLAPIVVNGVVFAASRGSKSDPGVLYALDPATGKQIWSSEKTIATSLSDAPIWFEGGQVYVASSDDNVYAFGPSMSRYVVASR